MGDSLLVLTALGIVGVVLLVQKAARPPDLVLSERWLKAQGQRTRETYDGPAWKWPVQKEP